MSGENENIEDKQDDKSSDLKSVDFFGTTIELPTDKADEVIKIRDERVQNYNQQLEELNNIKAKEEQARLEANEAKRKADALEAAKKGELEQAEELFTKNHKDKLIKYEQHSFRSAVKSELLNRDDIVKSAVEDAVSNIVSINQFELDDSFNVKSGDKSVTDVVNEYVDARDYMKLANINKPTNTPDKTGTVEQKKIPSLSDGLAALMNNANK